MVEQTAGVHSPMQRPDRSEDLARGATLIPHRPEVMPDQADERVRAMYEDIQRTLRVPFVNFIFRVLANDPDYLDAAWGRWRPVLRTRTFERAADELRAQALLEPVPDASGVDWASLGDLARVRAFTDSIHYVLPKLLVVATAFDEDLLGDRTPEKRPAHGSDAAGSAEIPLGVAEGTEKVPMVDPGVATGRLRDLFAAIKERHGHPGVATYYRSLGHWPDFLGALWERIEPRVGTAPYEQRKRLLGEAARAAVDALVPAAGPFAPCPKNGDELRGLLSVFRFKIIPDLFLDVSLIEAVLGGPDAAWRSRFSAAGEERV